MAKDSPRHELFSPIVWQALWRLAVVVSVAVLIGAIANRIALALAIGLGGYALLQAFNLLRLERWLRRRRVVAPPDIYGPWGEVVSIVARIYRRKQYHKARVVALLREFRRLTSAMPDGAILLGPENEILWFNRTAATWLQLRRKRDFGMRIENLIRHPDFGAYLQQEDAAGGVVIQQSVTGDLWLSLHLVTTPHAQRRLLIVRDVSRQVRMESMRKDFVANASHELRSPLTVISGYLDSLADDHSLDPTWNAPILEMRRQTERMGEILKDLLELSKLESQVRQDAGEPIDIAGLMALKRKEVLGLERRPRTFQLKVDSTDWLRGAESEIHSVVDNLVTNAVKYTPAEGSIELRWWTDEKGGYLAVSDTGVGIAPEHIPRLTERFYRIDSGRARDKGGSGLGLAIVKHALQRHEATLEVDSKEGEGSTFTCHFPRARIIPRPQLTAVGDHNRKAAD
ncbi:MAG TPA: phosphate regulon sensor histidine kinase PhoR [Steroidobacteraceae bacterium]|nr:phosphate regulon sensor histidine kinase PhoR [Steroidobacteraceae bacterium]